MTETSLSPVVAEGMRLLTARINCGTGLKHPSDKAAAVGMVRALLAARERIDADELRSWAVQHGWSPDGSDQLHAVASALAEGRVVRTTTPGGWKPDIVERLRERMRRKTEGGG